MEIIATTLITLVYLMVFHQKHRIPEYVRGLMIGAVSYTVVAVNDHFTGCAMNPAEALPLIFVEKEY